LRDDNVAACVFSISCSESVEKAFGTHFCPQGHLRKQKAIRHDILGAGVVRVFAAYGEFIYYLSAGVGGNLAGELGQNELIQDFGTLVQLGSAEVDIGTGGEKALALGRIHLDMGHMPEGADEIALEPEVPLACHLWPRWSLSLAASFVSILHCGDLVWAGWSRRQAQSA